MCMILKNYGNYAFVCNGGKILILDEGVFV